MTGSGRRVLATHSAATADALAPFADACDRLLVAGRRTTKTSDEPVGLLTDRDIDYRPLQDYSTWGGMLAALPGNAMRILRGARTCDVVYLRVPEPLSLLAGVICALTRKRMISSVVADPSTLRGDDNGGLPGRAVSAVLVGLSRFVVRRSQATTYVTRASLQRIIPPGKAPTLVRSNVRNVEIRPDPPLRRQSGHALRIVHVGNHQTLGKGQETLLSAAQILGNDGVKVSVTFVGGGRLQVWLLEEARRRGVTASTMGQVADRQQLNEVLDAHDIFVLPSQSEGVPRALIEAMGRGLPCVATDVGGIAELLSQDFLVRPRDPEGLAAAIDLLRTDDALYQDAVRKNQETAATISELAAPARLTTFLVENGPR